MTGTLDSIKSQVQNLSAAERLDLADYLLAVDAPGSDGGAAGRAEIARRVAEIRAGAVAFRPVNEVVASLRERA